MVVFAGELLKNAKYFIEQGMNSQFIIKWYKAATKLSIEHLKKLSFNIENEEFENSLGKCAEISLNSKLLGHYKEFFAAMVVRAVMAVDKEAPKYMIGIKSVLGGSIQNSQLVEGVVFKKTFSYAGFEQQPKKIENAKVLCLDVELELKSERDNAEIRIDNIKDFQGIVNAEWKIIYDKLKACVDLGANVVLSSLPIGDLATQYFADRGIFCAGRVEEKDMQRVLKLTGAKL